ADCRAAGRGRRLRALADLCGRRADRDRQAADEPAQLGPPSLAVEIGAGATVDQAVTLTTPVPLSALDGGGSPALPPFVSVNTRALAGLAAGASAPVLLTVTAPVGQGAATIRGSVTARQPGVADAPLGITLTIARWTAATVPDRFSSITS